MKKPDQRTRYTWLFFSLIFLIASYPYFSDTTTGTALGALTSLLVLVAGVWAVRAHHKIQIISGVLALTALGASVYSLVGQIRGSIWSESSFTAYYIFITIVVFVEVIRERRFDRDAILGIVSVYLLIGIAFGSLYDLLETIEPGSFVISVEGFADTHIGFRQLLFYSFMTLTSVGYGDITPITDRAQSLAILEGVMGVLYVAVLVGGIVTAYRPRYERDSQSEPKQRGRRK
jgi:hypothetical protein